MHTQGGQPETSWMPQPTENTATKGPYPTQQPQQLNGNPNTTIAKPVNAALAEKAKATSNSRRRRRIICCAVILPLFLIGLAVTLFFVWPRAPTLNVQDPTINQNSVQVPSTVNSVSAIALSFILNVPVNVSSPNYIDYVIGSIDISAFNSNYANGSKSLGVAQLRDLTIKKFATSSFNIPVNVSYAAASDPDFTFTTYLINLCNSNQKIPLSLSITGFLAAFPFIKPTFGTSTSFPCPPGLVSFASQARRLIGS